MILLLLFENILTTFAIKEYVSACFTIDKGEKPNIRIWFDSGLPFIPKMIQMNIPVRENIGGEPIQFSDETIHILRLTDEPCVEEFEYEVPYSSQPSQQIDIIFSWGGNPAVVIEKFRFIVMPDFEESDHILDGLMEHCRMKINLKKEIFDELATLPEYKFPEKVNWQPERREVVPGKTYCASFFTLEFKNLLVFDKGSSKELLAYEFYKFTLGVSFQLYGLIKSNKGYLTRIYPCEESEYREKKLKILADPKVRYITIAFTVAPLKREYRIIYVKNKGFTFTLGSNSFIFSYLVIKSKYFEKDLTYMDDAILLYFHKLVFTSIPIKLTGNTIVGKVAGVEDLKREDHVLRQRFYVVDMSEEDLKVFKIKVVSKLESPQFLINRIG